MIERWLADLVATPGLTAVSGEEARRVHLEESLAALEVVERLEGAYSVVAIVDEAHRLGELILGDSCRALHGLSG